MTDRATDTALQVRGLFDAKAVTWPSKYAPGGRLAGRLTRLTDAVAYHVPAGGSVLDLGCGTGELAIALTTSGIRAIGCDISPEMLRIAADADVPGNVDDWVELEPDWRVLPFRGGVFDAVIASSVLEYVDDPIAVLRECRRVLRPGGIVLCTIPDSRHPVRWLEWLIRFVASEPVLRSAGRHWPRLDRYLDYLQVSRHRHRVRWWHLTAAEADLREIRYQACSQERTPLRLLSLHRPKMRDST